MSGEVKRAYLLTDEDVRTVCGNLTLVRSLLEGFAKENPAELERSTKAATELAALVDELLEQKAQHEREEFAGQKAEVSRG